MTGSVEALDLRIISFCRRMFLPVARSALFVVFFWFGALKLLGISPASPIAVVLTERTVGVEAFSALFIILACVECIIGLLFLMPRATRIVIPLLFIHMAVVCTPLVLVPDHIWTSPLALTLEGQYIVKNIIIVAVAIGIAAQTPPLRPSLIQESK